MICAASRVLSHWCFVAPELRPPTNRPSKAGVWTRRSASCSRPDSRLYSARNCHADHARGGRAPRDHSKAATRRLARTTGLKATEGPGGVILVVRAQALPAPRVTPEYPSTPGNAIREAKPPSSGRSPVVLRPCNGDRIADEPADSAVPPTSVDGSGLQSATSVLQGGGLEAAHAMPGVAAVDDFRTDFSVRGSPYRQIGIVVDGVATHWLQHSVSGRDDAGSVSMFGSDILERATLETGAYPRTVRRRAGCRPRVDRQGRVSGLDAFPRHGRRHHRGIQRRRPDWVRRARLVDCGCMQQLSLVATGVTVSERCRVRVRGRARETGLRHTLLRNSSASRRSAADRRWTPWMRRIRDSLAMGRMGQGSSPWAGDRHSARTPSSANNCSTLVRTS